MKIPTLFSKPLMNIPLDSKSSVFFVLPLILALHVFFYFLAAPGLVGNDDAIYTRIASDILRGQFQLTADQFANRFGVTLPTSLSYLLFGVNVYSTTLWPLLSSLLTIVTVFLVASKLFGTRIALFSSFCLATNITQIRYSLHLLPDVIVSMFMFASISAVYFARNTSSPKLKVLFTVIFLLSFIFALATKETAVWLLPFLIMLMIYDFLYSKNRRFWLLTFSFIILMIAIYLGIYYLLTGDLLYRLKGVEKGHNIRLYSYLGKSYIEYLKRLTYEPFLVLLRAPGLTILIILSMPSLVKIFRHTSSFNVNTRYWSVYTIVILSLFWFGTTSLAYYNPIPARQRMLLPIIAPLSILSGVTLNFLLFHELKIRKSLSKFLSISCFVVAVSVLFSVDGLVKRSVLFVGYLAFFLLFSMVGITFPSSYKLLRGLQKNAIVVVMLSFIISCGFTMSSGFVGELSHQRAEREIINDYLLNVNNPTLIFTDRRSVGVLLFYFKFNVPREVKLVTWDNLDHFQRIDNSKSLIYINNHRLESLSRYGNEIPRYAKIQPPNWKLISSRDRISLFEIMMESEMR